MCRRYNGRRVPDFQKVFPKARDVAAQAELIKDDVIAYNRKVAQLNAELETIPERCPVEVAAMCGMIASNKLQADDHAYLVGKNDRTIGGEGGRLKRDIFSSD